MRTTSSRVLARKSSSSCATIAGSDADEDGGLEAARGAAGADGFGRLETRDEAWGAADGGAKACGVSVVEKCGNGMWVALGVSETSRVGGVLFHARSQTGLAVDTRSESEASNEGKVFSVPLGGFALTSGTASVGVAERLRAKSSGLLTCVDGSGG